MSQTSASLASGKIMSSLRSDSLAGKKRFSASAKRGEKAGDVDEAADVFVVLFVFACLRKDIWFF